MTVFFGLASALMFGLLDLLIARVSKTLGIMSTIVFAHGAAASILLIYLFAHGSPTSFGFPSGEISTLLWVGAGLGMLSCLTNLSLYQGLSFGPMALISPLTASYGLITILLAIVFLHEIPSPATSVIFLAMIGGMILATNTGTNEMAAQTVIRPSRTTTIFLISTLALSLLTGSILFVLLGWLEVPSWLVLFWSVCETTCVLLACSFALVPLFIRHQRWAKQKQQVGLLFGMGAMLGFGSEYFLLSLATAHLGPIAPVAVSRVGSTFLLFAYARHQRVEGWGYIKLKHFSAMALIGLLDVLGTICYNLGTVQSTVLVATLSSIYPLLPLLVGIFWYRERISLLQWGGVSILMLGMVVLSLLRT